MYIALLKKVNPDFQLVDDRHWAILPMALLIVLYKVVLTFESCG